VNDVSTTRPEHGVPDVRVSLPARILRWRNWRLPVKLGAVMLVPVLVCLALGFALISAQVDKASQYARSNRITGLNQAIRDSISALQTERQQVANPSAASQNPPRAVVWQQVDTALATARHEITAESASGNLDPATAAEWATVDRQVTELAPVRAAQQAGQPGSVDPSTQVNDYTQMIGALLAFDRMLATDVSDEQVARQAMALYDVFAAREEVRYQQAAVLAGITAGMMSVSNVTALHGSEARMAGRISDFHTVADANVADAYARAVAGPILANQSNLLSQAIDQSGGMSGISQPGMMIQIPVGAWNGANQAVVAGLDQVIDDVSSQLAATSTTLQRQAATNAGLAGAALAGTLVVAMAVMILMARQLLRSIGLLRDWARDIAGRQLPSTVERIRAGEAVDPTVIPVPVRSTDEVGQLARAFDAVHAEARRLAVEQANLRANYTDLFRNLSRRSQGLVQRQLRLIEQLERDEEDPDQLGALFQLDHLATRMRRNNENLMVLSGGELGRGPGQPIALTDVLRAAVSEIEHYQRVQVQPPPQAQIVGYAAGDLVRLLAELLDNATTFSAPDTEVTISSHRGRGRAIVVDIVDQGIGMNDEELAQANEALVEAEGVESRVTRRLGLFVVARLASQHGVRVRLHGGPDIPGLRVTVTVPGEVVVPEPEPIRPSILAAGPTLSARSDDPSDTEMTIIIPVVPAVESSGINLFRPLSDADGEAEDGEAAASAAKPEGTPIFDDMLLSAWFQATKPEPAGSTVNGDTPAEPAEEEPVWPSEADEAWRKAGAVAEAPPAEYTAAGLPKRQPRARLVPGGVSGQPETSAAHSTAVPAVPTEVTAEVTADVTAAPVATTGVAATPAPTNGRHTRDPELVRHRMSGFQRGVRRGRELAGAIPESAVPEQPGPEHMVAEHLPAEPTVFAPSAFEPSAFEPAVPEPAAEPTVPKPAAPKPAAEPTVPKPAATEPTIAEPTATEPPAPAQPAAFTAAGLPKRQPKARLLRESVAADGDSAAGSRDAGLLRDRLNSFQQGVRRGRNGGSVLAAERVLSDIEHEVEWEQE
jgi:signal transduction histidine kinase